MHIVFARSNAAAYRNACGVHRFRIIGDEWMPPVEIMPFCEPAVSASRRKPDQSLDIARRKPDAILYLGGPIAVVAAFACRAVEETAGHVRKVRPLAIVRIFQFDQTAASAPIAEALPFGIRHLAQRLAFPEGHVVGRHGKLAVMGEGLRPPQGISTPEEVAHFHSLCGYRAIVWNCSFE